MAAKRNIWFLIAAIVFAGAAAFAAVRLVKSFNETRFVVVAVKDLAAYTAITREDVKIAEVPAAAVPKDAFFKIGEVEGKYLRYPVFAGEVLRSARFASVQPDKGLMSAKLTSLNRPDLRA
ncbi:MAG: SAF domain-containing protein, partial [Anaerolineae bacterium]